MRHLALLTCLSLISSPALAGFEWIPPQKSGQQMGNQIQRQGADEALSPDWQEQAQGVPNTVSQNSNYVEAVPLANDAPTSLFPASQQEAQQQARAQAQRPKQNLSGKALVINPYPLRKGSMAPPMQGAQAYKAMQEEASLLNPVKLGGGYSTGAKPKAIPFPQPFREASTARKTYAQPPAINKGITPMMGGEAAKLPRAMPSKMKLAKNDNRQYAQAIGFGQDLPMALALSQVIPADMTHSFAKDVDAGLSVSWEGGKAWNIVLNDMLRPHNLTAVIQDNQVIIQPMAAL